ncbi:B12-binding domain-containing protein [Dechloromonas sp. HYN0024]|uniref:cobalamin B12-binding domain-containing protein n=1 Tax=Dechloromonas sp. HYN0024 TaxID=2231055 RepID=UPI000E43A206|nr:cobalamin-dependent protein [Dechloromonas sp. HYN0024]AXS79918.1 cobalamin-binding protein [Dechloromonas sp. HYN0024]
MINHAGFQVLGADGLRHFKELQTDAVRAVSDRFFSAHDSAYQRFGPRGREACREDLAFHLEFLRPVLEFGLLQPMIDYLHWLNSVLVARGIPTEHLALSLDWLGEYFVEHMAAPHGNIVGHTQVAVRSTFQNAEAAPTLLQSPEAWPAAADFETTLLRGDKREALAIVQGLLDDGLSLVDIECHVIQPAMYEIGEKWQANQVSVAQEHLATAIAQMVMTMGVLSSPTAAQTRKSILLACVEGNQHVLGLSMVCDAFHLAGWEVQYLGANVPTRSLVQHVKETKPDIVGLSVSFPQQLLIVKDVIAQLTEQIGPSRPSVMVGGLAINRFNSLANILGADSSCSDALGAVACAASMGGVSP